MRRFLAFCTLFFAVLFGAFACGRSVLLEDTPTPTPINTTDSGVDPDGPCRPETCPSGCCDASGRCRAGSDNTACGEDGVRCTNCLAQQKICTSTGECGTSVSRCDSSTCPNGCCQGNVCVQGDGDTTCGRGGGACVNCANQNRRCNAATRSCDLPARCSPQNCDGCCVGNTCQSGGAATACGIKGAACNNCAERGQLCRNGSCEGAPVCDARTCPNGCCDERGLCRPGGDNTACGKGGGKCSLCGPGTVCNGLVCEPEQRCDPLNCNGCCIGNFCLQDGNLPTACGRNGVACKDCQGGGLVCESGECTQPRCGPDNCAGCCSGNICVVGGLDTACGLGGQACADCTENAEVCRGGRCETACGPQSCGGCCEGNQCRGGFLNNRCGSQGAACADCAGQMQVCDTNTRSCVTPAQCPAAYPGCDPAIRTPVVTRQQTCQPQNLQDARVACAAGPNTTSCKNYFAFLAQNAAACGVCLGNFRSSFEDRSGINACVAGFVDDSCNRNSACAVDCGERSCNACGGQETQCRTNVRTGQCQAFELAASCVGTALAGPAVVCNPVTYGQDFGAWLEGVGAFYCNAP
jgi:hypothetical protein